MTLRKPAPATHAALTLALLASLLMASSPTVAQTCNAPAVWPGIGPLLSGTTCGGEHVADSFCNGIHENPGPNFVVRIYLNHTATAITLIGGTAGFDPVMYLANGADSCDSATCVGVGDSGTPINLAGIPPGYYWLFIAASAQNQTGACGSFALAADGDLSGDDIIFANGFDG
ncbi:MAG: hypothetical protein ABIR10_03040 [Dokdonella sp.]